MTSGLARGTVFQEVRPGAGFKTGDFGEENAEGAIVKSLSTSDNALIKKSSRLI